MVMYHSSAAGAASDKWKPLRARRFGGAFLQRVMIKSLLYPEDRSMGKSRSARQGVICSGISMLQRVIMKKRHR